MSSAEAKEKKETVIALKHVPRKSWLPPGHDGEYRFTNTELWESPATEWNTGQLLTGLTPEDEDRLEKKMKLPAGTLSKYNKSFWAKFRIRIPREGRLFDINNPKDELEVLVLRAIPRIANSAMEIMDTPGATHYLTSVEKEAEVENAKDNMERKAIKRFGQLSRAEQIDTIRVYGLLEGKAVAKITKSTPIDLIESTLYKKLKNDPEEFMRIVDDPSFKTRALIDELVSKRILIRQGSKYMPYGATDAIGATLEDAIIYLEDPKNQDVLIALKAKLEAVQ